MLSNIKKYSAAALLAIFAVSQFAPITAYAQTTQAEVALTYDASSQASQNIKQGAQKVALVNYNISVKNGVFNLPTATFDLDTSKAVASDIVKLYVYKSDAMIGTGAFDGSGRAKVDINTIIANDTTQIWEVKADIAAGAKVGNKISIGLSNLSFPTQSEFSFTKMPIGMSNPMTVVGPTTNLPDLKPTKLEIKNTTRSAGAWEYGDAIDISYSIQNVGTASAGKFYYTIEWGDPVDRRVGYLISLNPQESSGLYTDKVLWSNAVKGNVAFTLTVDSEKQIQETDEGNNVLVQTVNTSGSNLPPVITGVSGPTSLKVNETGSWTITANDPDGGYLSYTVDWGDAASAQPTSDKSQTQDQKATFTHSYSKAGTYTIAFTVTDDKGASAKATLSVNVTSADNPSVTVISPNGGETWIKNTTQTIKWQDNTPMPPCPDSAQCAPPAPKSYDIKLLSYSSCPIGPCPMIAVMSYTIADNLSGYSSYDWSVGKVKNINGSDVTAPNGSYTVQICQTGTTVCDSSDSYFKIADIATNQPSITSLSPTFAQTGEILNIFGSNLNKYSLSGIYFGTKFFQFIPDFYPSVVTSEKIVLTIPQGAISGKVAISYNTPEGIYDAQGPYLTIINKTTPTITRISPTSGTPGTTLTIYGKNLQDDCGKREERVCQLTVSIGGHEIKRDRFVEFKVMWLQDRVSLIVPKGAQTDAVRIVRVDSENPDKSYDISGPIFTVVEKSRPVTILSPKAENNWIAGKTHTIAWQFTTSRFPLQLGIDVFTVDCSSNCVAEIYQRVYEKYEREGKFLWTIPASQVSGKYQIGISITDLSVPEEYRGTTTIWSDILSIAPAGTSTEPEQIAQRTPPTHLPAAHFTEKAQLLQGDKIDELLSEIRELRSTVREQETKIKYLEKLTAGATDELASETEEQLNAFITYGVDENTKRLGAGERAAVLYSYKSAYDKLPETEAELEDAIRIANGRWPYKRSEEAESQAKTSFKKIYLRDPDMNNPNDSAAVMIMTYGLKQQAKNRNLNSEGRAIGTFRSIHKRTPTSTDDWNIVQATAYSGAKR